MIIMTKITKTNVGIDEQQSNFLVIVFVKIIMMIIMTLVIQFTKGIVIMTMVSNKEHEETNPVFFVFVNSPFYYCFYILRFEAKGA